MSQPIRFAVVAAYLYGLLSLLEVAHPGWRHEFRHEICRLARGRLEQQRLEGRMHDLWVWRQTKREVVAELLAHRINLREAADRFHELNDTHASLAWWDDFRQRIAADSDDERHYLEVIDATRRLLESRSPVDAKIVTPRLQAELREQLEQGSL